MRYKNPNPTTQLPLSAPPLHQPPHIPIASLLTHGHPCPKDTSGGLTACGGEGKQWLPMEVGTGRRTSTTTSSRWCSSATPASASPTSARRPFASTQPPATVPSCRGHTRPLLSLLAALTGVLDGAPRSGRPRPQVGLPL